MMIPDTILDQKQEPTIKTQLCLLGYKGANNSENNAIFLKVMTTIAKLIENAAHIRLPELGGLYYQADRQVWATPATHAELGVVIALEKEHGEAAYQAILTLLEEISELTWTALAYVVDIKTDEVIDAWLYDECRIFGLSKPSIPLTAHGKIEKNTCTVLLNSLSPVCIGLSVTALAKKVHDAKNTPINDVLRAQWAEPHEIQVIKQIAINVVPRS